jgi:hypothetical protein
MRAVVADTAPLNYLILIAAVEILPLFLGNDFGRTVLDPLSLGWA